MWQKKPHSRRLSCSSWERIKHKESCWMVGRTFPLLRTETNTINLIYVSAAHLQSGVSVGESKLHLSLIPDLRLKQNQSVPLETGWVWASLPLGKSEMGKEHGFIKLGKLLCKWRWFSHDWVTDLYNLPVTGITFCCNTSSTIFQVHWVHASCLCFRFHILHCA